MKSTHLKGYFEEHGFNQSQKTHLKQILATTLVNDIAKLEYQLNQKENLLENIYEKLDTCNFTIDELKEMIKPTQEEIIRGVDE